MNLERHDSRLVEATEECKKRLGGMSSLVLEEIPCGTTYHIEGEYKEMFVLGSIFKESILHNVRDDFIIHSPVTLETADLSKPCVYERSLGVLYVFSGSHEIVISRLLQDYLKMNSAQVQSQLEKAKMTASDYYLKHFKGACFRSGSSKKITVGSVDHLTPNEYDILKKNGFDEAF
ncbi:hypothetical protein [Acinetobacter sp. TGL-Y2]|uniref:hypothetical protein n=1 Tax=Acinetobacter sp. TGL-Y2 TaxID=1407071 RepID=UPI00123759AF|nr:hypothetical protein [Acinetobacter sp. TGL-Y2]